MEPTKMTKTLTVIALLLAAVLPARAELKLDEGDCVVIVGNTFAERLALSGYLDAMVHAANPGKNIVVRSVPNSADEVGKMPRERAVPTADFYLKRHKANVIFLCFGMSESFKGEAGLESFKAGLSGQVDKHLNAKYSGEAPLLVLVSPIAHEDLGAPLVTGDALAKRNADLKAYTAAMKEVALAKGAMFIDLFNVDVQPAGGESLTNNGIAPTEYGCFVYAAEMAKQLGWWDGNKGEGNMEGVAAMRAVAYDKHYQFRLRYRATNTEYVWGRRHRPFGIVNFPPELDHIDGMVDAREQAMWKMGKPTIEQLFAKAPSGKAIWETQPDNYVYESDDWAGVELELNGDDAMGEVGPIAPPEEYLKSFQVADGFQVNLFASEGEFPELESPLAISFDYKGRLWVLCAPTYPHPYPGEVADCKLIILDDTDNDGKADKLTVFADKLNIPTGFVIDANGVAYVGQAPDLWKLTDTDGDDVADRKEMVYSGFGMPDSHHTISAFTWDPNGGIMMAEGVFTKTNVETPYGTQRTVDAAVWRFDPRTHKLIAVSHTSHPNPWGHTYDAYGQSIYMDTSGSHHYNFSSLISPYIGANKPKKSPPMLKRGRPNAGSEIIYSAHWPEEYQGVYVHSQCIGFLGTHADKLVSDGSKNSGYATKPMPQAILSSKISNYRPVCTEIGQDGAMYIVDWVNPLIGHMQFNLRDPRRDKIHGRIYRVSHKTNPVLEKIDLTKLDIAGLLKVIETTTEQNTRDRARRLLQSMHKDAVVKAVDDWLFRELDPRAREYDYEQMSLEALWIQQAHGVYDTRVIDEVTRARNPQVLAGAIRAIRYGLQFKDMAPDNAESFIARAVTDRDMRVRLEAVMACAFLDPDKGIQLANLVTNADMDAPIRNAHQATMKYLEHRGGKDLSLLPKYYLRMDAGELAGEFAKLQKKNGANDSLILAIVARDDVPIALRREAYALSGDNAQAKAKTLGKAVAVNLFDPSRTAKAITPLLLELPDEGVQAIGEELDAMLGSATPGLRSAAVALKVRSGASLDALAERDPVALLDAVSSLGPGQASDSLPGALIDLAAAGKIDAGTAILQADRLSPDKGVLFERLASLVEPVLAVGYDQWGDAHRLAMAALAGMHSTPDEDWPGGYERYRLSRATDRMLELGKEKYFHHEQGCVKCHGHHGEGTQGFPAIAGSQTLVGDPVRAATIVKHGLMGELLHTVNPSDGKPFNAQMEPLSYFSDAEIAAVVTYARQHFGNYAAPVTVEHVMASRPAAGDSVMWDAAELLAVFPFERDRLMGPVPGPQIKVVKWQPPSLGLWLMLAAVGLSMALILLPTYFASGLPQPQAGAHPA